MTGKTSSARFLYLTFICITASLGGFLFGFDTAVISGVVGFIKEEFSMSAAMEGWFVSCALLGCIAGASVAGKLSDHYGRKKVLLLSAVLFTISAIGCMLSKEEAVLIAFRFIGGLGIGVASMISPLYISEFSPALLRGRMVALYQLAITVGILCTYFSNAALLKYSTGSPLLKNDFFHWIVTGHVWRSMLGMGVIPSLVFLVCLFFLPESPRWLLMKKREGRAEKVLVKINDEKAARTEMKAIKASFINERSDFSELFSPVYRTALVIGLLLPFLSQVSEINAIIYYGPRILNEAGFALGHAFGGQVVIGVVNMLFTFVAIFTVDKWGRKPLLTLGVSSVVASLVIIGLLFRLDVQEGPWILLLILIFIASFAFSFGPVCWIIIGEIFPTAVRGRAMSICTLALWIGTFLVGQLTPVMLDGIGPAATFWIFAVVCSPTLLLVWKMVPETKGKSLEEIERYWKKAK